MRNYQQTWNSQVITPSPNCYYDIQLALLAITFIGLQVEQKEKGSPFGVNEITDPCKKEQTANRGCKLDF